MSSEKLKSVREVVGSYHNQTEQLWQRLDQKLDRHEDALIDIGTDLALAENYLCMGGLQDFGRMLLELEDLMKEGTLVANEALVEATACKSSMYCDQSVPNEPENCSAMAILDADQTAEEERTDADVTSADSVNKFKETAIEDSRNSKLIDLSSELNASQQESAANEVPSSQPFFGSPDTIYPEIQGSVESSRDPSRSESYNNKTDQEKDGIGQLSSPRITDGNEAIHHT